MTKGVRQVFLVLLIFFTYLPDVKDKEAEEIFRTFSASIKLTSKMIVQESENLKEQSFLEMYVTS